MKYMMLVYLGEQAMSESEREDCYVESAQLAQQLNSSGQFLDASPLHRLLRFPGRRSTRITRKLTNEPEWS